MEENLFSKIDQQNDVLSNISNRLDELNSKIESSIKTPSSSNTDNKQVIKDFIKKSNKYYNWMGTDKDFYRDKNLLLLSLFGVLILGLISTILTSISLKIYSTFTLFENIVVFCACCQLLHTIKAKRKYSTLELSENNVDIFKLDADGVWRDTNQEKKRYKVFRRISYIAIVCNIVCIWIMPNPSHSVLSTIFEVLFLAIIIVSRFLYCNLFCMYNIVYFEGRNQSNTQNVTLVYDSMLKVLLPREEYEKKYPFFK